MYTLLGGVLALYDGLMPVLSGQDFTPLTTRALDAAHVPADLRPLALGVLVMLTGELFVALRKITVAPLPPKLGQDPG